MRPQIAPPGYQGPDPDPPPDLPSILTAVAVAPRLGVAASAPHPRRDEFVVDWELDAARAVQP